MIDRSQIQVCLLVGGLGTRIRPALGDTPKAMAPVAGIPFLEILVSYFKNHGFNKFILLCGYGAEELRDYFADGSRFGVEVRYSNESKPLGTGGALRNARKLVTSEYFVLANGDSLPEKELPESFLKELPTEDCLRILGFEVQDAQRFGSLLLDSSGERVVSFSEKSGESNLVSGGIYLCRKQLLDFLDQFQQEKLSLEVEVLPKLLENSSIPVSSTSFSFTDIGTPSSYREFEKQMDATI